MRSINRRMLAAITMAGLATAMTVGASGPALASGFANVILAATEGGPPVTSFAPDTAEFVLSADITDEVSSGSKVTVTWVSVDTGGVAPPNYQIYASDFDVGMTDNRLDVALSKPTNGWPVGTYQVQLSVNGKVDQTIDFAVK